MIRDPETHRILIDSISRFVRERLIPAEEAVAEHDEIPAEILSEMKAIGLFGLTVPEDFGGFGLTMEEEVEVTFELTQASPAFRSIMGTNNGIGAQGIVIDGSPEQKASFLPRLASGELIGSFALTEPGAGSDAGSLTTSARREGDEYVINGTKRYITNAPEAGVFTVMARTGGPGSAGVSAFIVERERAGIHVGKPDKKMGQRGAHTADVIFENCRVPAANLIGGKEGMGFKTAMKVLDKGRLTIAAACVGSATRMPVAEFQLVQAMLADSQAELYAARAMVLDAARRRDAGEDVALHASCCKLFASEACGRIADRCVQCYGGAGYISDYPIERFYRDVRLFRIFEGTSQIQQLIIGRGLVKQGHLIRT
jgi:acyl-CoA dehydrogenase